MSTCESDLKAYLDKFNSLNVLVIGDIIIDEYVFCNVMGLMSKDRGLSVRYKSEESYLGGALAVARHLSNFVHSTTVCSMAGKEFHIHSKMLDELSKDMFLDLCISEEYRTIVKRRMVEKLGEREEYRKLFSINNLMTVSETQKINRDCFYKKLNSIAGSYDMVFLADFGHGLIDQIAMDIIQEKSKYLALNCQTNSTNYGTNLITKYHRSDCFSLDEREIALATGTHNETYEMLLRKLQKHLGSQYGWLTLGSAGAVCVGNNDELVKSPALTLSVKDTVGAGDAFFSIASLCAKIGADIEVATFMANVAGAIAANTLGNSKPVTNTSFLEFVDNLKAKNGR